MTNNHHNLDSFGPDGDQNTALELEDGSWCPIDLVLHVIGARWTVPIVKDLSKGARRPSELSKTLKGISPKTLTERLRDLEKWGLVDRKAYEEIPPRVEYSLTERGQELLYVMEALRDIGLGWQRSLKIDVPPFVKEQCTHCFDHGKKKSREDGHLSIDRGKRG